MQGNLLSAEFLKIRSKLQEEQVLTAAIDWHAAPVINSIKPSALINLGRPDTSILSHLWKQHCNSLTPHYKTMKMHFQLLHSLNGSLHLFCYKPERMRDIYINYDARTFLADMGYPSLDSNKMIPLLKYRFRLGCPHEIGILLGYPVEDVKGFIENKGRNYLINGYWKVYSDVPRALRLFHSFNTAKKQMIIKWKKTGSNKEWGNGLNEYGE